MKTTDLIAARAELSGSVMAILPSYLDTMKAILGIVPHLHMEHGGMRDAIKITAARPARLSRSSNQGSTAIIPLHGFIQPKATILTEWFGGTGLDQFVGWLDAALGSPDVGKIVIDVDSPGGLSRGVEEASKAVFEARNVKPITAQTSGLMASAAYYIGSAADRIIATPSSIVGSIGVVGMHTEFSEAFAKEGIKNTVISAGKYKTEGNPYEPLTEEAQAEMQRRVDSLYKIFLSDVARNRGITSAKVSADYGQGRVFTGKEAKAAGLVDKLGTMADAADAVGGGGRRGAAAALAGCV